MIFHFLKLYNKNTLLGIEIPTNDIPRISFPTSSYVHCTYVHSININ